MRYYRRRRHGDKRFRKILLRILFVLFAAALITFLTVLLGHHVKNLVEEAEKTIQSAETGIHSEVESPYDHIDAGNHVKKVTVSSVGLFPLVEGDISPLLDSIKQHFDTVSVNITAYGRLCYVSPAMLELARIPENDSAWETARYDHQRMQAFGSAVKRANFRISAVLDASAAGEEFLAENDKALIAELAGFGFDEVVITGISSLTDDAVAYLTRIRHDNMDIGVVLPHECYLDSKNEKMLRLLSASGIFLCVDLNMEDIALDDVAENTKALCTELRSKLSAQNLRVFIDSENVNCVASEYGALREARVSNIQIASVHQMHELVPKLTAPTNKEQPETENTAKDIGAPVNPYITTSKEETGSVQEKEPAETKSTDNSSSNPIWY